MKDSERLHGEENLSGFTLDRIAWYGNAVPIYEYRCGDCGKTFEYIHRMSDEPKSVCEACGGSLERLISQSAFVLKGSGWYKDLYSSPKPEADASKSSDGAKEGGDKKSGNGNKETKSGSGKDSGAGSAKSGE